MYEHDRSVDIGFLQSNSADHSVDSSNSQSPIANQKHIYVNENPTVEYRDVSCTNSPLP